MEEMVITQLDIDIAREKLRQEQVTFNQGAKRDTMLLVLQSVMGAVAVIAFVAILVWALNVLNNSDNYHNATVISAVVALLGEFAGLLISIWKIVLNPIFFTKLKPEIKKRK